MPGELFDTAWQAHQADELARAEDLYRRILQREPRNGGVWFVLGRLGDWPEVFRRMADELQNLVAQAPPRTILIEIDRHELNQRIEGLEAELRCAKPESVHRLRAELTRLHAQATPINPYGK